MRLPRPNEIPWVLLTTTFVVTWAHASPALALALEDRSSLARPESNSPELWRAITGHLTHGSTRHAILNLALLVPLLGWREQKMGSRRALAEFLVLALAVAVGIRILHHGWWSYRGLSGVVYGLLALTLLERMSSPDPSPAGRLAPTAALLVLVAKTTFELSSGGWAFNDAELASSLGVRYLPGSHVAGMLGAAALHAATGRRADWIHAARGTVLHPDLAIVQKSTLASASGKP